MEDEKKAELQASKIVELKESPYTNKLAKLIDVKSIMTLVMTIAFVAMTMNGSGNDQYTDIFKTIVIFYFGTQATKKA